MQSHSVLPCLIFMCSLNRTRSFWFTPFSVRFRFTTVTNHKMNSGDLLLNDIIPEPLKKHILNDMKSSFTHWEGDEELKSSVIDSLLKELLEVDRNSTLDPPSIRRNIATQSAIISRVLRASPRHIKELLDMRKDESFRISKQILKTHEQHKEINSQIFVNITQHHKRLIHEVWDESVSNVDALRTYATAAEAMGKKPWVQEGYAFMENFINDYFIQGGAVRVYVKQLKSRYKTQPPQPVESKQQQKESCPSPATYEAPLNFSLLASALKTNSLQGHGAVGVAAGDSQDDRRKIRILDVGSCYNYFHSCASCVDYCVTAIDLFPMEPTVHTCDFLKVRVGPREEGLLLASSCTAETVVMPETDTSSSSSQPSTTKSDSVLQLPESSYDAITLSLVLSYLPTPELRKQMIEKARRLLVCPKIDINLDLFRASPDIVASDQSLASVAFEAPGTLIVLEKVSIFNANNIPSDQLRQQWIRVIEAVGFRLIRYQLLVQANGHRTHALIFHTVDDSKQLVNEVSSRAAVDSDKLHIRQDFQHDDPI